MGACTHPACLVAPAGKHFRTSPLVGTAKMGGVGASIHSADTCWVAVLLCTRSGLARRTLLHQQQPRSRVVQVKTLQSWVRLQAQRWRHLRRPAQASWSQWSLQPLSLASWLWLATVRPPWSRRLVDMLQQTVQLQMQRQPLPRLWISPGRHSHLQQRQPLPGRSSHLRAETGNPERMQQLRYSSQLQAMQTLHAHGRCTSQTSPQVDCTLARYAR